MLNFAGIKLLARVKEIGTMTMVPLSVPVTFPGYKVPMGFGADSLTTVPFVCRSSRDTGDALIREKALNAAARKLNIVMVAEPYKGESSKSQ
jgi:hypothetical protein